MIWAGFTILMLVAVVSDARTYRIPNWISIALGALFVLAVLLSGQPFLSFWPHFVLAAAVLGGSYLLYQLTGMGAGDAKLGSAIALWSGITGLYTLTFMLGLAMAILALSLIVLRRALPAGVTDKMRVFQKGAHVPLGVALGLSAIAASFRFDPALWSF